MNFRNILDELQKAGDGALEQNGDRRSMLKSISSKAAAAAIPLTLAGLLGSSSASAKTTASDMIDSMNLALELAYMQYNLYHTANATGGLIPTADKPGFLTIENQEKAHISYLKTTITALGGTPFTPNHYNPNDTNPLLVPTAYDFTKGGTYFTFADYNHFLTIASVIEDTTIHAYKGQISSFLADKDRLTIFFQMQSVHGRHAAHTRTLRRLAVGALEEPAPWITNDIPPYVDLKTYYKGENNVIQQSNIVITELTDTYSNDETVPEASATAAFDEAMTKEQVMTLIAPFKLP